MLYKVQELVIFAGKEPKLVMLSHPLTSFEIKEYYQDENKFNVVYSGKNLPKLKDRYKQQIFMISNQQKLLRLPFMWIVIMQHVFDSFGVKYITQKRKKIISNKNITANIYRIWAIDSTICGWFCVRFINFVLKGKVW